MRGIFFLVARKKKFFLARQNILIRQDKTSYYGIKNYFQALKIYNQALKINNQALKIYFQALKIIILGVSECFIWRSGMFYLAFRDVFLDRKTVFSVYVLKKKKMKKKGIIRYYSYFCC